MSGSEALTPGLMLRSTACAVQVVVIRAPTTQVNLTCGGQPLTTADGSGPRETAGEVLLGKRYVDEESGLELLCVRSGAGPLAADDRELTVKTAKPLPSSD